MYPINEKQCLNKFKAVRCLSGRDLFSRLGERIPTDRGVQLSRNPAVRQDYANEVIMDGFNKLSEIPDLPPDVPPAVAEESDS